MFNSHSTAIAELLDNAVDEVLISNIRTLNIITIIRESHVFFPFLILGVGAKWRNLCENR